MIRGVLLLGLLVACERTVSPRAAASDTASAATSTTVTAPHIIGRDTVFYIEASDAEIESAKKETSEEDFAVIADDMMFYRASAQQLLDTASIPYARLNGRRAITFRVNGAAQVFDFKDSQLLDLLIVYKTDQAPKWFAANEVDQARDYWRSPR